MRKEKIYLKLFYDCVYDKNTVIKVSFRYRDVIFLYTVLHFYWLLLWLFSSN